MYVLNKHVLGWPLGNEGSFIPIITIYSFITSFPTKGQGLKLKSTLTTSNLAAGDLEMELDEETTARQLGMLGQEIKVCVIVFISRINI